MVGPFARCACAVVVVSVDAGVNSVAANCEKKERGAGAMLAIEVLAVCNVGTRRT